MANRARLGQFGGVMMMAATATNPQSSAYKTRVNMATQPPPQHAAPASNNYADQRVVDAQFAVADARTDTKFAQLLGKMDAFGAQLADFKSDLRDLKVATSTTKTIIISTMIASTFAIVGLAYAAVQIFESALNIPR